MLDVAGKDERNDLCRLPITSLLTACNGVLAPFLGQASEEDPPIISHLCSTSLTFNKK
jgi:hypothetical protein